MVTAAPLAEPARRVLVLARLGDERLAERVARGEAAAFSAIYERYHQPLFRLCLAILRHEADAQDALQSTFERALSALEQGRRNAPLRPWLYRIAHNEAISIHRRRRALEPLEDIPEAAVAPSAEEVAARRASLATLLADLADLPERARSALVLRELSGLSHEDIATVLGVSTGAAKQAIFEARRALAELAEGRLMTCEAVQRMISDGDRRALRSRRLRAHLHDCAGCRAFEAAIPARRAELRALTPALAPAAAAAILARTLGSGSGAAPASMSGTLSTGLAGKAMVGAGAKLAALVAVLGTAGGVAVVAKVLPHRGGAVGQPRPSSSHAAPPTRSVRSAAPAREAGATRGSASASPTRPHTTWTPVATRAHRSAAPGTVAGTGTVPASSAAYAHSRARPGTSTAAANRARHPTSAHTQTAPQASRRHTKTPVAHGRRPVPAPAAPRAHSRHSS